MAEDVRVGSDDGVDLYVAAKRRRWKRVGIGLGVAVVLGGVAYGVYWQLYRFDHLVSQLGECEVGNDSVDTPDLPKDCRVVVKKLSRYALTECPRLVEAIKRLGKKKGNRKAGNAQNLLLWAILEGRQAGWEKKERGGHGSHLTRRTLAGDSCVERAALAVHHGACAKGRCKPEGYGSSDEQEMRGLAYYTARRLSWGVRVRLLGKLDPVSLAGVTEQAVQRLARWQKTQDPPIRKTLQEHGKTYLQPALVRLYQALRQGAVQSTGMARWERKKGKARVATELFPLLPQVVDGKTALAAMVLQHLTRRIMFGEHKHYETFDAHMKLVKEASRQVSWMPGLRKRVSNLYVRSPQRALRLLQELDPKQPLARTLMARYADRALREHPALAGKWVLGRVVERVGSVGLTMRYFLATRFGRIRLDKTLASLVGRLRTDGRELVRRMLVARIADLLTEPRARCRPFAVYFSKAWALPRNRWLVEHFGVPWKGLCAEKKGHPGGGKVLVWPEALVKRGKILVALSDLDALRKRLGAADADTRFFAVAALARQAPETRRGLLRERLADATPSVRALAAFLYAWPGVARAGKRTLERRDVLQGKARVTFRTRLAKDANPLVRYAAFAGVRGDPEAMARFAADACPAIRRAYSEATLSWKRKPLLELLARKDAGAGHALLAVLKRVGTKKHPDMVLDAGLKQRLMALTKHPSPYVRRELARGVLYQGLDALDLSALLWDRSPAVVEAMLEYLWLRLPLSKRTWTPALRDHYLVHIQGLMRHGDLENRVSAIRFFTRVEWTKAIPMLKEQAAHRACPVRAAALEALKFMSAGDGKSAPDCKP